MFWERRFPIVGIGPFVGPNLRPSQGEGLRGSWEAGRSLPVVLTLLISPFSLFFFSPRDQIRPAWPRDSAAAARGPRRMPA